MKRHLFMFLLGCMILFLAFSAAADESPWTCPGCGQEGNTGNFCSNCATPRPSASWACSVCGQQGNTGNFCSNCAAPRPSAGQAPAQPAAQPAQVNDQLEQIPGETNRVKVRVRSVEGDPYIRNAEDASRWVPGNAADGDESTCWQFSSGGKKTLSKNWLTLTLASPQTVDSIWFKNGFWGYSTTGTDQYPLNSRPKNIRVDFRYQNGADYTDPVDITLQDDRARQDWQRFDLGRHSQVTGVRIRVITYYTGSKFPKDICLSEVMLVQQASASSASAARATNPPTVYEAPKLPSSANLLNYLSTREGPSTSYNEPGTFFKKNSVWKEKTVRVMSKAFDGSIWWVQVDFSSGSASYRVWTGLKRVDVDLNRVKESTPIGIMDMYPTDTWWGPGGSYAKTKKPNVYGETDIEIYGRENGYLEVDYYDVNWEVQRRCWVPESKAYNIRWY